MQYHEAETTVAEDGSIRLERAPFPAGHRVRLTILDLDGEAMSNSVPAARRLPIEEVQRLLAGSIRHYGDPFGSAFTDEEIEAIENEPIFPDEPRK